MARPKKINSAALTPEEQDVLFVVNHATNSDKISWQRKYNNLQKLIDTLSPLEEQMIELTAKCMPIHDEINELRKLMVEECIHPADMLVHKGDHLECKFCLKTIVITKN